MREVPRHDIDPEKAAQQVRTFGLAVQDSVEDLPEYPEGVSMLMNESLTRMRYQCALDPAVAEGPTWEGVVEAMQVGSAMFAVTTREQGTPVDCVIGTQTIAIPAAGPKAYWTTAGSWLNALWLAMACLEKDRTDMLCGIPLDRLRVEGVQNDPFMFQWVDALQSYWRGEPYFDKLLEAIKGTDPEAITVGDTEFVLFQLYPAMRAFSHLALDEHEQFNEALAEALDLHRQYWTKDAERAADPAGFVALAPTALATFANAKGFPIEVESGYMPKHLVAGTWYGTFST